jgi:malate dehydrogenase
MAGILDSARLRYFIAEELGVSTTGVEAMTLGSHGDAMVALPRHATVDGKPLPSWSTSTLERLFQRTRDGGAEIVALLEDRIGVLRAERVGRRDGRGDRRGHEGVAAGVRVDDGRVRDRRRLRRGAGELGAAASRRSSSSISTTTSSGQLRAAAEGIRRKCADLAKL